MATKAKKAPTKKAPSKKASAKKTGPTKKSSALVERIVRREDTTNNLLKAYNNLESFYGALDKKIGPSNSDWVQLQVSRIIRFFENEIQKYDATLDRISNLIAKQYDR